MLTQKRRSWHKPEVANLPSDSYTAQRLTAWLNNHRRDWYKHHLSINCSTRVGTFSSDPREARQRQLSGLKGPSSSALFQDSFPQPEELDAEEGDDVQQPEASGANGTAGAAAATPPALQIARSSEGREDVVAETEDEYFVDAPSEPDDEDAGQLTNPRLTTRRSSEKTFVTASSVPMADDDGDDAEDQDAQHQQGLTQPIGLQMPSNGSEAGSKSLGKRPLSNTE